MEPITPKSREHLPTERQCGPFVERTVEIAKTYPKKPVNKISAAAPNLLALVDFGDRITKIYHGPKKNGLRSRKSTTKVQVWLSSLLNSLVEGITLLNTVTKCSGIESGEDPKTHF